MTLVDELTELLDQLRDDPERPLLGSSDPRRNQPPFRVSLAPWAVDIATCLTARFGDAVTVEVGHLQYLTRTPASIRPTALRHPLLNPLHTTVTAPADLQLRSGHDLRSTIFIESLGEKPLVVRTNAIVQSVIVDPTNGDVVGDFVGAQILPLVRLRVDPGQVIPGEILIGSASLRLGLGYSVPPGQWAFEAILDIEGLGLQRSPQLPIMLVS
jgi:hypothetical protein